MRRVLPAFALASSLLLIASAQAQSTFPPLEQSTYRPSVKIGTAALLDPAAADTQYYYAGTPSFTDGLAQYTNQTTPTPPEIVELARALNNNVDEIYDYVRNNIEISWTYGLGKGAVGAIIDKSGTAFDQAQLMFLLLKQAGYTPAYKAGTITLDGGAFTAWSGISDARAACQLLSSGGIPAAVNDSTSANCVYSGSLTNVRLSHIWIAVSGKELGGTTYVFDPAYKTHVFKTGVNLATAAGLTTGTALSQATDGMQLGTESSVSFVRSLNTTKLNETLVSYAQHLQDTIRDSLPAGEMQDLVGGQKISRLDPPNGQLRQTSLPYGSAEQHAWNSAIPDKYRTTLHVQISRVDGMTGLYPEIINRTLFVDEIYGRKLIFNTNFDANYDYNGTTSTGTLQLVHETQPTIDLQTYTVTGAETPGVSWGSGPRYSQGVLTLTANLPYAAASDGSASLSGTYMDATVEKPVYYAVPFTIVHGWGDTGPGLGDKWGRPKDGSFPAGAPGPIGGAVCELCYASYFSSLGDGRRQAMAASYLAQATQAAKLNASIAKAVYAQHYALGVVASDTYTAISCQSHNVIINDNGEDIGTGCNPGFYTYSVSDSFDRIDIDSAFSLTSKTVDGADRRAGIRAIASTTEALEASVSAQFSDLPDTSSTASRFEWGNNPPAGEDPSGVGARRVYQFNAANAAQASGLTKAEAQTSTTASDIVTASDLAAANTDMIMGSGELLSRKHSLAMAINSFAQSGFSVTASEEAFLGPGRRAGAYEAVNPYQHLTEHRYTHSYSHERGGALVAVRNDANGDPVEIANIIVNTDVNGKGGGGGAQIFQQAQYDPAQAADILKAHFVDRSSAAGVDLKAGKVTYASPASLKVGSGEFPYSLTGQIIWRGGELSENQSFGPTVPSQPKAPWTTNWHNQLSMSGSGMEAMGVTDVRTSAGTVAAFLAMQDIFKGESSPQAETAALLAMAWWTHQISGNVATVTLGTNSRQFVKRFDNTWIAPGSGALATLTQTGERYPYREPPCANTVLAGTPISIGRGWNYSNMSFAVRNAGGDVQNFAFWKDDILDTATTCGIYHLHGFRLTNWVFPQGVTVNVSYRTDSIGWTADHILEVSNSLGRKIHFTNDGLSAMGTDGGFDNGLLGANARAVSVSETFTPVGSGWGNTYTHTDPSGAQTKFLVSTLGGKYVLTQVYTANNTSTTTPSLEYTYDSIGRVKEARDANRALHQFLIANGVIGKRIDPTGARYRVMYDVDGQPFRYIDELSRTTTVGYDGRGRPTSYIYPEGDCEQLDYDDRNNPVTFIRVDKQSSCNRYAGAAHTLTASAEWDPTWNKPTSVTDIRGKTTNLQYYGSGAGASLLQTATRPNGGVYSFTYTAFGKPLWTEDPTGLATLNDYDLSNGNLNWTKVDPDNLAAMTQFDYNAQGDVTQTTDPLGNISTATFDANRRQRFAIGPLPDTVHSRVATLNSYDPEGHLTKVERGTVSAADGSGWTARATVMTDYDPVGNKIKVTTDKSVTQMSYDGMNRVVCSTVRMNRNANGSFGVKDDACAFSVSTGYGPDRITKNFYDAAGQLRQIVRGFGLGADLQQVYATYKYSPNGKQVAVADGEAIAWDHIGSSYWDGLNEATAADHQTNFTYDGFDRLIRTTYADATKDEVSYYDDAGNLCSGNGSPCTKTNRAGQVTKLTYNPIDLLVRKDVPAVSGASPAIAANTISWILDLAGRPSSVSDSRGTTITNHYDTMMRVDWTTTANGNFSKTVAYEYDLASNRTRITWPEGNYFVGYGYDGAGKMAGACENGNYTAAVNPCDAGALLTKYDFDELGRPVGQHNGNGTIASLSWSPDDEILTVSHNLAGTANDVAFETNDYTPAHQIRTADITNLAFRYVPQSTAIITYTPNRLNQYSDVGGQTFLYDANGNLTVNGNFTYQYDPENRLMTAKKSGIDAYTYAYDPLGRRLSKTVTSVSTIFLSADDDEIAEYDGAGTLLRRYVPGAAIDKPIAMVTAAGAKTWFHQDKLGSVVAMSDASGTMAEGPFTYDEYGNCHSGTQACELGSLAGVPYRYTGRRLDPETGLHYYRARYYSAAIGRFLQTDPIGYKDDINWYTYVGNDPTDKTDPMGLYSCGRSLTWGQCDEFLKRQSETVSQIRRNLGELRELKKGLSAKVLSDRTIALAKKYSGKVGASIQVAQNSGYVDKLIQRGEEDLGVLRGSMPAENASFSDYARAAPGKLLLSQTFWNASGTMQRETLAHEASHHGSHTADGGVYGRKQTGPIADWEGARVLNYADGVALGLGFKRDDDYE